MTNFDTYPQTNRNETKILAAEALRSTVESTTAVEHGRDDRIRTQLTSIALLVDQAAAIIGDFDRQEGIHPDYALHQDYGSIANLSGSFDRVAVNGDVKQFSTLFRIGTLDEIRYFSDSLPQLSTSHLYVDPHYGEIIARLKSRPSMSSYPYPHASSDIEFIKLFDKSFIQRIDDKQPVASTLRVINQSYGNFLKHEKNYRSVLYAIERCLIRWTSARAANKAPTD